MTQDGDPASVCDSSKRNAVIASGTLANMTKVADALNIIPAVEQITSFWKGGTYNG